MTGITLKLLLSLYALSATTTGESFSDTKSLCNASQSGKQWLWTSGTKTNANSQGVNGIDSIGRPEAAATATVAAVTPELSWWTDVPVLPLVFATSTTLPEGRCRKETQRYLQALNNSTLWAVEMFDASTKYPDGVMLGNTKHLGNFDQCYNLRAKLRSEETDDPEYGDEIEGRYCLIRFRYQRKGTVPPPSSKSYTLDFDPNVSAWDAIDDRGDFRRVKRNSIYMALCVPTSCSYEDVAAALTQPLEELADARGIRLETSVKSALCQARRDVPKQFTTMTKVFCFFVTALVVLVIGCSWYDSSIYSTDDEPRDVWLCFSARRNLRMIFSASGSHPGLECIHLIRFFFMTGVIFGHRIMQYSGYPMLDATAIEKMHSIPFATMVTNGPLVVDGFFSIGGLLLTYYLLEELDRSKRLNFLALLGLRFLRLTPLYMLVVFFNATLMPFLGSGPYWEARVGSDRDNCANNWWTNILYINNYVKAKEICMFQSWYLSVDYHLYIVGLLVIRVFWRLPRRLGYPFLGALIAVGTAIPFAITYTLNEQPIFLGMPFMREIRKDPFFVKHYIKSHLRFGPYMVGVLAGAIIYDHKKATWRLPKIWSRLLFLLLAVGLTITSQSLSAKYFDPNNVVHPLESAIYAGFHRPAFALGICSIVVLITIGDGLEFHHNFMTPRWAPPLARLTYGAFLLHNIDQTYAIGITRTPRIFSLYNCLRDLVVDVVWAFALSLLMSTMVEGPIRMIEKFMFPKGPGKPPTKRSLSCNGFKKIN